jgi:hypothetical protein
MPNTNGSLDGKVAAQRVKGRGAGRVDEEATGIIVGAVWQ